MLLKAANMMNKTDSTFTEAAAEKKIFSIRMQTFAVLIFSCSMQTFAAVLV